MHKKEDLHVDGDSAEREWQMEKVCVKLRRKEAIYIHREPPSLNRSDGL